MQDTLIRVQEVLVETLALQMQPSELSVETPLFGALPELDSLGVAELVVALEADFGFTIEDDEFGADLFETVGTLANFVDDKVGGASASVDG